MPHPNFNSVASTKVKLSGGGKDDIVRREDEDRSIAVIFKQNIKRHEHLVNGCMLKRQ
jgi:hypothetical protein